MHNVFIGVGGSGTKVAEALVRLLAMGYPTRREPNGLLTSAGDRISFWRLDPDASSGAAAALQYTIGRYKQMQDLLAGGAVSPGSASSAWSMDVDQTIQHLDPLQLPGNGATSRTLRGILGSHGTNGLDPAALLDVFFEPKDLSVSVDRGFYQKPFIGATVMAIYATSLTSPDAPGSRQTQLTQLQNRPVRFFLCGSLHGGTGASGIPVLANFLADYRNARKDATSDWRIGACLLGPYSKPPQPPFGRLKPGEPEPPSLDPYVERIGREPWAAGMTPEEKRDLARQILHGFYADPDEMELRTRHGLEYFKRHVSADLDEVYLVGKREPDPLQGWSNGGKSQNNPLNSAEVAAALTALNFFSSARTSHAGQYTVAGLTTNANSQRLTLKDLPTYDVDGAFGTEPIDPERVMLATGMARHLILHQMPWGVAANQWTGFESMRAHYAGDETRQAAEYNRYNQALAILGELTSTTLSPDRALGWDASDVSQLAPLFGDDEGSKSFVSQKLANGWFTAEAREPVMLGNSEVRISSQEFGKLVPPSGMSGPGAYLRFVWSTLYNKRA